MNQCSDFGMMKINSFQSLENFTFLLDMQIILETAENFV